jgi:hypothetical protein
VADGIDPLFAGQPARVVHVPRKHSPVVAILAPEPLEKALVVDAVALQHLAVDGISEFVMEVAVKGGFGRGECVARPL